jgi:hypothetical protein
MRDSKRAAAYRAERVAFPGAFSSYPGLSIEECQTIVNKIWQSQWRRREYPTAWAPPTVRHKRGTWARGGPYYISLPSQARSMPVLLHELAHSLTPGQRHNREWARAFVALVERWIGVEDARRLKAAFKHQRVKYSRRKNLAPEVKQQLRERGLSWAAQYALKN